MILSYDIEKGRRVAPLLYTAFRTTGIHGRVDMPEDRPPAGVETGSREHLLFLTLAVSIDYQRDAYALWESARRTYEDTETRYLFDPRALHEASYARVFADLEKYNLSKKTSCGHKHLAHGGHLAVQEVGREPAKLSGRLRV